MHCKLHKTQKYQHISGFYSLRYSTDKIDNNIPVLGWMPQFRSR